MELMNLKKIGLTEGEIRIYEALLDLGECTKTSLAKKSGVAPSNIYDITNRLLEKGIISRVEKNGVAHFSPANPKRIVDYLEQKKSDIDKEKDLISSLLPVLVSKYKRKREGINVEVFNGWKGMKNVFSDLIDECDKGEENYIFGASRGERGEQADRFFLRYSKKRADKGIITRIIFNEDLRQRKERVGFFLKSKMCDVRFLQQSTPAEILIYKNRSCIIILAEEPLVIRINGKEVFESFRQYFDFMWKTAKP